MENRQGGAASSSSSLCGIDVEPALPDFERRLDGIAGARRIDRRPAKAILNHLQRVAALLVDSRIALRGQQRLDFGFA